MKNINVNVQRPPTNIPLGRRGENLATCIIFDCSGLVQLYGDGTAELLHELKDGTIYPVAVTQDGASVSWTVSASDTATVGAGRAELRWYVGDTLAKSAKFRTSVSSALADSTTETPPEPQKSWVDKVLAAAQEIKDGAISDEQLAEAIAAYLEDHPIDAGLDEAALAAYLVENGYLTNTELADAIAQALADAKASGQFDGAPGKDGADGGYYAPSVDDDGNLTWTASADNMPAVTGANIKGPRGDTGPQGPQGDKGDTGATGAQGPAGADGQPGADGKSAYQYAKDGGYTGTEEEFAAKMAQEIPTVDATLTQAGQAADAAAVGEQLGNLSEENAELKGDLDNKIEHVGGYKEYDIGTPNVGTYWNKTAKKQLESETYQSFNPISLKAGTYHYENMSGSFTFYEDTDGNWIPIGKYSASGNGDVVITNNTTMYISEMQKSGVFVGAKLSSGDITQKESNWFKNPKYDIDNINNTLESLSDSAIKEYCIYVSTTGSDTSGDGSEEKPFATIYHANETITDNSYTKRYRIIVLPGTYTDLQDKYTGIAHTNKYQGVITKPWVTYESKSGNPKDTIIEWDGSTGLENPTRDDVVDKCAFHIVSLPRTFTAIKGFTVKGKNTRYAMHCESGGNGIQGEWLIENCIFDWGGCPDISDDTGKIPAIGIGMSPCEKGTIKFCKIVTTTVETMLVHDGKNTSGNSAVILGAELNFIKCDLGTGRLQFQSIYPKSGEINAKTNNICNLVNCTQINNLYSYISKLNSDGEMVWRVYEKDCDFAGYGNMSDYVYKIGTANNVSN